MLVNSSLSYACLSKHSSRNLRCLTLLICLSALAFLSLFPDLEKLLGPLGCDTVNHITAYALLTILLIWNLAAWGSGRSDRILVTAWTVSFATGLLFEGMQWLMNAGRLWEVSDLFANALGAFTGCVMIRCITVRASVKPQVKRLPKLS